MNICLNSRSMEKKKIEQSREGGKRKVSFHDRQLATHWLSNLINQEKKKSCSHFH